MPCSPEQLASNRRNARRSTGPKTEQGKARSRANGFKHGLAGAGVALPIEDEAEVDARFEELADDLKPRDGRERILARRAALLALRLDRCAQFEASSLSRLIRNAVADYDDAVADQVDHAFETIGDDPSGSVRVLSRSTQGVDRMIRAWEELADGLAHLGYWSFPQTTLAENLTGRRKDAPGDSRIMALSAASIGDFRLLEPQDCEPPADMVRHQARKDAARDALIALTRGEADRLRVFRAALPHDDLARTRAEAPLRRLFDPSPAATLFRRYEGAAARELHKTFALFDPNRPDISDPTSSESGGCVELGSLGNLPVGEEGHRGGMGSVLASPVGRINPDVETSAGPIDRGCEDATPANRTIQEDVIGDRTPSDPEGCDELGSLRQTEPTALVPEAAPPEIAPGADDPGDRPASEGPSAPINRAGSQEIDVPGWPERIGTGPGGSIAESNGFRGQASSQGGGEQGDSKVVGRAKTGTGSGGTPSGVCPPFSPG